LLKKLASLLLGLVFTFALVEGGLALAYRGFVWAQARKNRAAAAEGEVRILAIGESTTAVAGDPTGRYLTPETAWPAQLERVLNERQDRITFRVMNNGIMGGTTASSMDLLEMTLPELRPQVIIAMMGIKDTVSDPDTERGVPGWAASLRTAQLVGWLLEGEGLKREAVVTDVEDAEEIPESMREMDGPTRNYVMETRVLEEPYSGALPGLKVSLYYWYISRPEKAERYARQAIEEYGVGYNVLAQVLASVGRRAEAREVLEAAAAEHPEEGMYLAVLASLLVEAGELDAAQEVLEQIEEGMAGYSQPEIVRNYQLLSLADIQRERGQYQEALETLDAVKPEFLGRYKELFPAPELLKEGGLGQVYLALKDWDLAERHLRRALDWNPRRHVNMFLLSRVYRETGQTEKEEAVRRELLRTTGRMAEYFELAKLFKRSGAGDRVPALIADAVAEIPSLKESYKELYALVEREGIQLVVMQYPSFSEEALHLYAPEKEGVIFIDNEHVFDADPDGYFFEPKFPHSFSHYTDSGARVLAEEIADVLLPLYAE
jgi:tetratricopeptide (TPR) repeat protein